MSYPKPLSEKSLLKRYADAGISEEKAGFLRDFFAACTNLYGAFHAFEAWEVYKELSCKTKTPALHRKDMYAALGILRRESLPYYVLEADEVYSEEPRTDRLRVIASRELIGRGYGKLFPFYQLMETLMDQPFFVPKNLLAYKDGMFDESPGELIAFLEELKCTEKYYKNLGGEERLCQYTGKRLKDFSFISSGDQFELDYLRGKLGRRKPDLKRAEELERSLHRYNAAQRLVYDLQRDSRLGLLSPTQSMEYFFQNAEEMGLSFSEKQLEQLMAMISDLHNHTHLWCIRGWMPEQLARSMPRGGTPEISFGPSLQKAFAKGDIDKEELLKEIRKRGFTVVD